MPLGAGYLTFVARGRVQQFGGDRDVDAWMLLFAPEVLGGQRDDPLRAPAVLSPVWTVPALAVPPDEMRELLELVEQLAAEQARPFDSLQEPVLAALLQNTITNPQKLLSAVQHLVPQSFYDDVAEGFRRAPMSLRVSPYLLSLI
ncbi:MAG TPA: hypothetical protein VNO30_04715, partial [Kofleriaceae bacterium]|nr:hypothetical protein [Kofleriaceae bacterium]